MWSMSTFFNQNKRKCFHKNGVRLSRISWGHQMVAFTLFKDTNMAALTSRENTLFIESEVKVLYVRSESSQFGSKGLPGPLTFSTFFVQMGLYYVTYVIFFIIWELAVQVEMPFPPFMDHTCKLTWMHGVPKPSIFGSSKLVSCAKCSNASDIKSLTRIRLN